MPPRSLNRLLQKRIACYHESSIRGSNSLQTTAASNEEGRKRRKQLGELLPVVSHRKVPAAQLESRCK
jgi:hypothetical protein